ncbi:phage regulatory protein [Pseudomonas protegens]|uniref:Phage regulatory protein n=1 Tax=Pseudomonas protegens TaxID=380021 RepID=A0A2T6GB31_9PSED|nr:Rha family transcriptional regulator [Pseudomonas protegens]PUA41369.1 phage regulatory protein [Pseudomonas protegens]
MTSKNPATQVATTNVSNEVAIEIFNGKSTTTSLDVAQHFGKPHKDVLRAIRSLECSPKFHERNFAPMEIEVQIGLGKTRKDQAFRMTRDGFTFLCMGFTGKEAAQWKEAYIDAFNKMEQALIEQPEWLSHHHLLKFAIKTLDLMRDNTRDQPVRPETEQVVRNYLAIEAMDQASPEQIQRAITFLQGQIIGEGLAAKSLPGVAGTSISKDLLYGLLRSAHDAELLFNSLYDSGVDKLASDAFKSHMAGKLADTLRQARDLLGYIASFATRDPHSYKFTQH